MTPIFSSETLGRLLREAAASSEEICGILCGDGAAILDARPAANVAADPARHFEIDPAILFAAHRQARRGGPAVIGCYHSHPGGRPEPSWHDRENGGAADFVWLIAGISGPEGAMALAGFTGEAFEPVSLISAL